jgi:hypothetical protein
MPDQFWSLTVREFWIKHAAFSRAEDRAEAALIRQALRLGQFKKSAANELSRYANALKRYPIKPWLVKSP